MSNPNTLVTHHINKAQTCYSKNLVTPKNLVTLVTHHFNLMLSMDLKWCTYPIKFHVLNNLYDCAHTISLWLGLESQCKYANTTFWKKEVFVPMYSLIDEVQTSTWHWNSRIKLHALCKFGTWYTNCNV